MANIDLKNTLDAIIDSIEDSMGKGSRPARKAIQDDPNVQFFVLHEPTVFEEIDSIGFDPHLVKANGGVALPVLSNTEKKEVLNAFEEGYLKNAHVRLKSKYPKTKSGKSLQGKYERHLKKLREKYKHGKEFRVYIVGSYATIRKVKKEKFVRTLEAIWKRKGAKPGAYEEMAQRAGGASPKKVAGEDAKADIGFQLGHGEYGVASSEITGARGEATYEQQKRTKLSKPGAKVTEGKLDKIDDIFSEYRSNFNADIKHDNIVTAKGDLRKDFFIVLSFQKSSSNQSDAAEVESAAQEKLLKDLKIQRKLVEGDTSIPLRDCIAQTLTEALTKNTRRTLATKGLKIRYTGIKPKAKIKQQGKARLKDNITFKERIKVTGGPSVAKLAISKSLNVNKTNKKTASATSKQKMGSPIATLNYINKSLATEITKNMQSPGLENRSGRFADSVRALNFIPGKGRKWPILQYTYDKDPYQVFEMGQGDRRWATRARDPQTIIGKTLREMAAEQALGRFTTQRI